MQFTAKLVSDRSATPSRSTIKEGEYFVHCFVRHDSLVGVCLTDEEFVFFIFFFKFFWGWMERETYRVAYLRWFLNMKFFFTMVELCELVETSVRTGFFSQDL